MKINLKKVLKMILVIFLFLLLIFIVYFFIGFPKKTKNITWGVNFSQKHAQNLGLDWRKTYSALLDDLGAKNIKIATHWDLVEPEEGKYNFEDLDWQVSEAEKRGVKVILVIGMKTPRWPECHIPKWAVNLDKEKQQEKLLELVEEIVLRYQESKAIKYWQVENEPFFSFGKCPWFDKEILKKEIDLVKSLDSQNKPVIISESGEFSTWTRAAKVADIVGTTLYRRIWSEEFKTYFTHIFPPTFYNRRALIINKIFGKKVICVELQAEPWGPKLLYDLSLEEQEKSMDLNRFRKNIEFAERTGFDEIYLWGAEWWFWLREKHNEPEIWQEAKKLFLKKR